MESPDKFLLARMDEVQKSLCTTPGFSVGVEVGVHIYVKVFYRFIGHKGKKLGHKVKS